MSALSVPPKVPSVPPSSTTRASAEVVNIHEAKTHFSKLLARVAAGEEIVIGRAGKPIAVLRPVEERPRVEFGFMDLGGIPTDAFLVPMTDEELAEWE